MSLVDLPDPAALLNLPQKKVPRKLLTRPNGTKHDRPRAVCTKRQSAGVGGERLVVFIDPQNEDADFWQPAMARGWLCIHEELT